MKLSLFSSRVHPAWLAAGILTILAALPAAWAQNPGADLRTAATATRTQADIVIRTADTWARRANSASYNVDQFQLDFSHIQMQFQGLREQFNWTAALARQLRRARADNAVAELDAGLNIIAELFAFLQTQFDAGALDRNTILRTARAFEDAMRVWQREFTRASSRLGTL